CGARTLRMLTFASCMTVIGCWLTTRTAMAPAFSELSYRLRHWKKLLRSRRNLITADRESVSTHVRPNWSTRKVTFIFLKKKIKNQKTNTVMKKQNLYRTWGKPYGKGQSMVCEMSASSKKEAVKKLEANG